MNYEFYGVAGAGLFLIYIMLWIFARSIKRRNEVYYDSIRAELNIIVFTIRRIDEAVDDSVTVFGYDIADVKQATDEIKDRMSFLEAATIYTMPIEPSKPNQRSMAARKVHERRRQRKLENKGD